jgi:hypothetical protein
VGTCLNGDEMNGVYEILAKSSRANALPVHDDFAVIDQELVNHYERAAHWLLKSFQKNEYCGSSAWQSRFFHPVNGWSHSFPDTTGYIIPTIYDYLDWQTDHDGLSKRAIATSIDYYLFNFLLVHFPGGITSTSNPTVCRPETTCCARHRSQQHQYSVLLRYSAEFCDTATKRTTDVVMMRLLHVVII